MVATKNSTKRRAALSPAAAMIRGKRSIPTGASAEGVPCATNSFFITSFQGGIATFPLLDLRRPHNVLYDAPGGGYAQALCSRLTGSILKTHESGTIAGR